MFRRQAPAPAAAVPAEPAATSEPELGYAPRVAIVALADLLPREGVGSDAFYVAVRHGAASIARRSAECARIPTAKCAV